MSEIQNGGVSPPSYLAAESGLMKQGFNKPKIKSATYKMS